MYIHNAPALGRSTFTIPHLIPPQTYKNLIKSLTTDTVTTNHLAEDDVEDSPNEKLNMTEGKGAKSYP